MRKIIVILLLGMAALGLGQQPAQADGMIVPEALSPDYLVVRYHHVTVDIEEGHAVTRVEQEFYNPHSFPVEGRYLFPVPPEAIISGFQATVDGEAQTVARQDAAATNAALYDTIAHRRDPSLLQYADWESLAFDIALPPGGARQMSLQYEEVLAPTGGMYRYRYVLSTERYSAQPLEQVSVTVNLAVAGGISGLYSPTHEITTEQQGNGLARVSWSAEDARPVQDFELYITPTEADFGGGLLTGRREGENHFMFIFAPEMDQTERDAIPKDIVFVMDRSGSMSGEKIEQAHNALQFILGQLGEEDRFSIVGFDHRLSVFASTLQPVQPDNLAEARAFVRNLDAEGDTDIEAALQRGLTILDRSESRDASVMLIFLTDGLPTAGVTDEGLIARLVTEANSQARLHVFGVGYDVNTHLLDRLAADNGGMVTYVQPGESLEMALTQFYSNIAHPLLTDVEIEFEGLQAEAIYPQQLPDMFQGSSLLLTGRYRAAGSSVAVRVRGQVAGEGRTYTYRFDLAQSGNHDFVPRLWATRRVGVLLDEVRVEGESLSLVEEIRELGLAYGLVTPYTTFIIEGQTAGAASAENMALYQRQAELNQTSGQTTIQARVQNQSYQQTDRANLAQGANVVNYGDRSLAQISNQNIDLTLLQQNQEANPAITLDWLERNITVDRQITFGSEAYFALAEDPATRPYLQSGRNVIFTYQGETIAIEDPEDPPQEISQADSSQQRDLNNQRVQQQQRTDPARQSLLGALYSWLVSSLR